MSLTEVMTPSLLPRLRPLDKDALDFIERELIVAPVVRALSWFAICCAISSWRARLFAQLL